MKKAIVLPLLLLIPLLGGCRSGGDTPTPEPEEIDVEIPEGTDLDQTVNFYIDYWHSSEPYYTMMWYNTYPLGRCPAECKLTREDATDPLFPVFLGWSRYPSSIDDSHLWNFAKDSLIGSKLELYGIWVAEE